MDRALVQNDKTHYMLHCIACEFSSRIGSGIASAEYLCQSIGSSIDEAGHVKFRQVIVSFLINFVYLLSSEAHSAQERDFREGVLLETGMRAIVGERQIEIKSRVILDVADEGWMKIGSTKEGWSIWARQKNVSADKIELEWKIVMGQGAQEKLIASSVTLAPFGEFVELPRELIEDGSLKMNLKTAKVRYEAPRSQNQ